MMVSFSEVMQMWVNLKELQFLSTMHDGKLL